MFFQDLRSDAYGYVRIRLGDFDSCLAGGEAGIEPAGPPLQMSFPKLPSRASASRFEASDSADASKVTCAARHRQPIDKLCRVPRTFQKDGSAAADVKCRLAVLPLAELEHTDV